MVFWIIIIIIVFIAGILIENQRMKGKKDFYVSTWDTIKEFNLKESEKENAIYKDKINEVEAFYKVQLDAVLNDKHAIDILDLLDKEVCIIDVKDLLSRNESIIALAKLTSANLAGIGDQDVVYITDNGQSFFNDIKSKKRREDTTIKHG